MAENEILGGRPYGGCAIIWRSNLSHKVTKLHTNNNRLCTIRLHGDHYMIIVCVYFPTDTAGRFNQITVEQILGEIRALSLTYR